MGPWSVVFSILVLLLFIYLLSPKMISAGPIARLFWSILMGFVLAIFSFWLSINSNTELDARFLVKSLVNSHSDDIVNEKDSLKSILGKEFYFVDAASSQILHEGSLSGLPLTNREELRKLLVALGKYEGAVNFIVIDLVLEERTPYDDSLLEAMEPWARQGKLIIANLESDKTIVPRRFNCLAYAGHPSRENKFLNTTLITEQGISLAYQIYLKYRDVKLIDKPWYPEFLKCEKEGELHSTFLNELTPNLTLKSIDEAESPDQGSDLLKSNSNKLIPLSAFGEDDLEIFNYQFENFVTRGEKKVIMIGHFSGNQDIHSTINGDMYGTSIVLNIWFQLMLDKHKQFVFSLLEGALIATLMMYLKLSQQYFVRKTNFSLMKKKKWFFVIGSIFKQTESFIYLIVGFLLALAFRNLYVDLQDVIILLFLVTLVNKIISFRVGLSELSLNENK